MAKTILPEPIEREGIRVYDCPLCDYIITGTLEDARRHIQIPLGRGLVLPRGFTFGIHDGRENFEVDIVCSSRRLRYSEIKGYMYRANLTTHDFYYSLERYKYGVLIKEPPTKEGWRFLNRDDSYSNLFQEGLVKKWYFLLSEEQFEEFKQKRQYPHCLKRRISPENQKLMRTVEGIEKLLE